MGTIKRVRPDAKIALGRELSKLFEEVVVDEISNVIELFKDGIKGEIVCMVYAERDANLSDMEFQIKELKDKGFKDKEISVLTKKKYSANVSELWFADENNFTKNNLSEIVSTKSVGEVEFTKSEKISAKNLIAYAK